MHAYAREREREEKKKRKLKEKKKKQKTVNSHEWLKFIHDVNFSRKYITLCRNRKEQLRENALFRYKKNGHAETVGKVPQIRIQANSENSVILTKNVESEHASNDTDGDLFVW